MAYERQTFIDFDENNPLRAANLIHIEDGIIANEWTEEKKSEVVEAVIAKLPVYNGEVVE